jgi:hypothetical protein
VFRVPPFATLNLEPKTFSLQLLLQLQLFRVSRSEFCSTEPKTFGLQTAAATATATISGLLNLQLSTGCLLPTAFCFLPTQFFAPSLRPLRFIFRWSFGSHSVVSGYRLHVSRFEFRVSCFVFRVPPFATLNLEPKTFSLQLLLQLQLFRVSRSAFCSTETKTLDCKLLLQLQLFHVSRFATSYFRFQLLTFKHLKHPPSKT